MESPICSLLYNYDSYPEIAKTIILECGPAGRANLMATCKKMEKLVRPYHLEGECKECHKQNCSLLEARWKLVGCDFETYTPIDDGNNDAMVIPAFAITRHTVCTEIFPELSALLQVWWIDHEGGIPNVAVYFQDSIYQWKVPHDTITPGAGCFAINYDNGTATITVLTYEESGSWYCRWSAHLAIKGIRLPGFNCRCIQCTGHLHQVRV